MEADESRTKSRKTHQLGSRFMRNAVFRQNTRVVSNSKANVTKVKAIRGIALAIIHLTWLKDGPARSKRGFGVRSMHFFIR